MFAHCTAAYCLLFLLHSPSKRLIYDQDHSGELIDEFFFSTFRKDKKYYIKLLCIEVYASFNYFFGCAAFSIIKKENGFMKKFFLRKLVFLCAYSLSSSSRFVSIYFLCVTRDIELLFFYSPAKFLFGSFCARSEKCNFFFFFVS